MKVIDYLFLVTAGPGAYDAGGSLGKAPAFSMTSRHASTISSHTPGPGAYLSPKFYLDYSSLIWKIFVRVWSR